jgi:hypothetical protein
MKCSSQGLFLLFISIVFIFSCKKLAVEQTRSIPAIIQSDASLPCVEDAEVATRMDTILKPTILGFHLVNTPYSLANMQQAYRNLNYVSSGVAVTHKYVRFKPTSHQQHTTLLDLDIDLSDYPLDYEIVQEGDYYNDGVTPAESIPWLYAVVPVTFTPPAGIAYEVLQQIHVPALGAVENEAFRITGNPADINSCSGSTFATEDGGAVVNSEPPGGCPNGTHWDPIARACVPDPVQPPSPAPVRTPSGTITVYDNNLLVNRPLRNARVVAKRFLKIERTYTNNQGQYFLNKEFNKVRIKVKMKNDQAVIRALRRARVWQVLIPVEIDFGKFRGTLSNLSHVIMNNTDAKTVGARSWAAATAHNTIQEFRDHATQQGIGAPPNKLRVLMTNWRIQGTAGAAPLYATRAISTVPNTFISYFVVGNSSAVVGGFAALATVLAGNIDVSMGYNLGNDATTSSSEISETMFHEQGHAAHYVKWGNTQYGNFVNAEITEISGANPPYGNKGTPNSQFIALGESWAYHIGHFMANLKYGANAKIPLEQRFQYGNGNIYDFSGIQVATGLGLAQHLNLLEDFDATRTYDVFKWIPQGLYYDLMDNRNDNAVPSVRVRLNDNVSNYTNAQFFNALDPDIGSLAGFRIRLLAENGNNQAAGVTEIFTFYGY